MIAKLNKKMCVLLSLQESNSLSLDFQNGFTGKVEIRGTLDLHGNPVVQIVVDGVEIL